MESILDKIGLPIEETGDEERVHLWTGGIALLLIVYLVGLKAVFGKRAI